MKTEIPMYSYELRDRSTIKIPANLGNEQEIIKSQSYLNNHIFLSKGLQNYGDTAIAAIQAEFSQRTDSNRPNWRYVRSSKGAKAIRSLLFPDKKFDTTGKMTKIKSRLYQISRHYRYPPYLRSWQWRDEQLESLILPEPILKQKWIQMSICRSIKSLPNFHIRSAQ